MAKKTDNSQESTKAVTAVNGKQVPSLRATRKTYEITQRGIKSYDDLREFYAAAISDVDGGRADLNEMQQMGMFTAQMIALENLAYKVRNGAPKIKKGFFLA